MKPKSQEVHFRGQLPRLGPCAGPVVPPQAAFSSRRPDSLSAACSLCKLNMHTYVDEKTFPKSIVRSQFHSCPLVVWAPDPSQAHTRIPRTCMRVRERRVWSNGRGSWNVTVTWLFTNCKAMNFIIHCACARTNV